MIIIHPHTHTYMQNKILSRKLVGLEIKTFNF